MLFADFRPKKFASSSLSVPTPEDDDDDDDGNLERFAQDAKDTINRHFDNIYGGQCSGNDDCSFISYCDGSESETSRNDLSWQRLDFV